MRNLLIIGASHGIGAAIANLAHNEFQLFSISRTLPSRQLTTHFPCDVLHDSLPLISEPLAGLVYCPGSIVLKSFSTIKPDEFRQEMEINFFAAVKCLQQYLPNLQGAESASVVLFSTVAVKTGFPYHALVAAAKGAIEGLTLSLAAEWAPRIRVNAIAPSLIETPLSQRLLKDDSKKSAAAARHPLKRVGSADDVAQLALFLLSERSSWISGQILAVDGGVSSLICQ